jgi:AcrR family transcriptional regulator
MGFKARRIRRTAADARELILDAAEQQLIEQGPDSLRLVALAEKLGISHPAILHHFGSREGLVRAVVQRTAQRLETQVFATLRGDQGEAGAVSLFERLFRALTDEGHARLLVWLHLTNNNIDPVDYGARMRNMADALHAIRRTHRADADYEDTLFTVLLAGLALFGNAIAGEPLRTSAGLGGDPQANARFLAWLARLLREHLER